MTTDPNDQALPGGPSGLSGPPGFREGIYLEKKKSSIGTGGTAKATEYRNFWATGSVTGDSVVMVLLDSEFKPTAVRETFHLEALVEPVWFFITEGDKKYQHIRPFLDRLLAAPPQETPHHPAEAPPAPWWGGASPGGPPANPFELKKDPKKQQAVKKGGWWDK
jgi:hypothetical protein